MNITVCQIPVKGEQGDLWIGVFLHCFLILLDICVSVMYKHADLPRVQFLTLFHEHDLAGYIPVSYTHLCVELDFDIKSLSEILGHATVNITLNRYVHPSMELKQQNMQKMSALMKDLSKIP